MRKWLWMAALFSAAAGAADVPQMSSGYTFAQKDGKALYAASCQGCHMAKGEGARGAGFYPKLAGNPLVQSPEYIVFRVANGYRGMPAFAGMMSDEQIAAVTTYVRQSFAKPDAPATTVEDVRKLRQQ
ncbi:c-type cytochrome [Pseudoduganella umbonata]|uniref:Cytochrome c n=2 Tax=Pseudoduganella umbonata TaxID=864828 RepID=A0A4P8HRA0_9BURK|nr:cytochrome c [Pseudoduganella umbonata]MBB3220828.1 mono/diheme cytochrome c family protein [Pseudoduganella umbonata]QCP11706.1 cytochrome c [Pseudoduganella umbonata]